MQLALAEQQLSDRQRDYLMLTAFVLARHGYPERARTLAESLLALRADDDDAQLVCVVLRFLEKDYTAALAGLDHMDAGTQSRDRTRPETIRMRRYLRARCYCETGRRQEGELIARALLPEEPPPQRDLSNLS